MKLEDRWVQEAARLKKFVQEPALLYPDVEMAERILSAAHKLVEIAKAAAVAKMAEEEFWQDIGTLIKGHEEIYSEQVRLAEMRDALTDAKRRRAAPDDTKSTLTSIRENFALVEQYRNTVRNLQEEISSSSTNKLEELSRQIISAVQAQKNAIGKLEETLGELIGPELENNPSMSFGTMETNRSLVEQTTGNQDISGSGVSPKIPVAADSVNNIPEQGDSEEVLDQQGVKQEEHETSEEVEPSTGGAMIKQIDLSARRQKKETPSLEARSEQEHQEDEKRQVDYSGEELNEETETGEPKGVVPEMLSGQGAELLDTLLREGQFARAYWVAYASDSLIDPNILGALCEGRRIRPGESCRGDLAHFLNDLTAGQTDWSNDERLLLSAALLQPILFLRPYPEALYQLVNSSAVKATPLTNFIKYLRDTCLNRGIALESAITNKKPGQSEIETRLRNIAIEAKDFLDRVPQIGSGFRPVMMAAQFLYHRDSKWHRLHSLIADDKRQKVQEVKELCKQDPRAIVSTVHQKIDLREIGKPLDSWAQTKLIWHLYNSLALANKWVALAEKLDSGHVPEKEVQQSVNLRQQLEKRLPRIQQTLADHSQDPVRVAVKHRITELEKRLRDEESSPAMGVATACIDLPDTPLDNDMVPLDGYLRDLADAMSRLVNGKVTPRDVFLECLKRDEFVRAELLLERHNLSNDDAVHLKVCIDSRRKQLEQALLKLRMKVEDAFLLGELSEPNDQSTGGNAYLLTRSDLSSRISEGESKLQTGETELNVNIRAVTDIVQQVKSRVDKIVSSRQKRLHEEKESLIHKFPEDEQGREDREYFEQAFLECLKQEDDVAIFDLLDRAQQAITQNKSIARASIDSSESLDRFLKQSESYKKSLSRPKALQQLSPAIEGCKTTLGIPFGQLDANRRKESIEVLQVWSRLWKARFEQENTRATAAATVEEICQFVGFPVDLGRAYLRGTPREGMAHFSINFSASVSDSPIPAFGSSLGLNLDVVVCQRRKEPEQITEFLQQSGIQQKAVLVLLMDSESPNYRLKWQKRCAESRTTAIPLDLCLLVHLCGMRNRLPELFNIGLPFTWGHPYITKGETVAREMFVGRENEVRDLLDDTGGCIVFGGRQLGKSALLTHIRRQSHDPKEGEFIVYIDVDDLGVEPQTHEEMTETFWQRVAEQLIREEAIEIDKSVKRRNKYFSEITRPAIKQSLQKGRAKRIFLLLDEADDLLDCDSSLDFQLVRQLRALMAETERRFKVVFAGLQSVQRYKNWENHPFAQLGAEIMIDPLPPVAAQELIIRPFRSLGFAFENTRLVLRILSLTNYHPGLIQIFCYRLLEKLYAKWQKRDTNTPIRTISFDDIVSVERDNSLREDIRNRFDWTLDLDDRYKVITYALVLTSNPNEPRRETEFMQLGKDWWPSVFNDMDLQGLRAVLEEMVGLGVLLRDEKDQIRQYRLRSPNLLRLLGPQEAIEEELERLISLDRPNRPNPRNFHAKIDPKSDLFGPLSKEQEGQIADTTHPFSLVIVRGNSAMGLRDVKQHVGKLMKEITVPREELREWQEKPLKNVGGVLTTERVLDQLREIFKPQVRNHRYVILDFEESAFDGSLEGLFRRTISDVGKVCRRKSRGKVIVILGPEQVWDWVRSDKREYIEGNDRVTSVTVQRWSNGAIANALDNINLRTGSKMAGTDIFDLTGGIHSLVSETLRKSSSLKGDAKQAVDMAKEVRAKFLEPDNRAEFLTELGIISEKSVLELLGLQQEIDGVACLIETSIDLTIDMFRRSGEQHSEQLIDDILKWLHTLDIIQPANKMREKLGARYQICPWTAELLNAQKN